MQGQISTTQLNLAGLIHDMKSPLQALKGITTGIVTSNDLKDELIKEAADKLELLLEKMRFQTLNEVKKSHDAQFCLKNLIERLCQTKKIEYPFKRFSTKVVDNTFGQTFITGEKIEVERLLSNLLNNAIEALGQSGKIKILLNQTTEGISIDIKDNGHGISNDLLCHLAIAGNSFGKPQGSGLGLYQAKQTLESWNGKMNIESILSIGTIVSLSFPTNLTKSHLQLAHG